MSNGVKYAVATLAVVVAAAGAGGYFFVKHRVDTQIAELKTQGIEVVYGGLGFSVAGEAALSDVTADVAGQEIKAAKVSFSLLPGDQKWSAENLEMVEEGQSLRVAHLSGMATALTEKSTSGEVNVTAHGIELPLASIADGETDAETLREIFGGDNLMADLSLKASYDQQSMNISYGFGSSLFKFDLSGAFGGVDFVALARKVGEQPDGADALAMELMPLQLGNISLNLADSGLVDKLIAAQAKEQGISEEEVRGQWAANVGEMTAELRGAGIEGSEAWAVELEKLATSWKGLNFSLNPAEPVPLMSLMMTAQMDPNEAVKMMQPKLQAL